MVLLQVLEADLQVQLPGTRDNVLPGLLNDALKRATCQPEHRPRDNCVKPKGF